MEAFCRQVVGTIEAGDHDVELASECTVRAKNQSDFGPLFLKKVLDSATLSPSQRSCDRALEYAYPIWQLHFKNELPAQTTMMMHAMVVPWFEFLWRFRSTKVLATRRRVKEILLGLMLTHAPVVETVFNAYCMKEHRGELKADVVDKELEYELLVGFSKQLPSPQLWFDFIETQYNRMSIVTTSSSCDDQIISTLVLFGKVFQRNTRRGLFQARVLKHALWKTFLKDFNTTEDRKFLKTGLWMLSIIVPHVLRLGEDSTGISHSLVDLLCVIKKGMSSSSSYAKSDDTIEKWSAIGKTSAVVQNVEDTADSFEQDEPDLRTTSESCFKYLSYLYQSLYVMFPWPCLRFLHEECLENESFRSVAKELLEQLRVHPLSITVAQSPDDLEERSSSRHCPPALSPEALTLLVDSFRDPPPDDQTSRPQAPPFCKNIGEIEQELLFSQELMHHYRRESRQWRMKCHALEQATTVHVDEQEKPETQQQQQQQPTTNPRSSSMQFQLDHFRRQIHNLERAQTQETLESQRAMEKLAHEHKCLKEQNLALQMQQRRDAHALACHEQEAKEAGKALVAAQTTRSDYAKVVDELAQCRAQYQVLLEENMAWQELWGNDDKTTTQDHDHLVPDLVQPNSRNLTPSIDHHHHHHHHVATQTLEDQTTLIDHDHIQEQLKQQLDTNDRLTRMLVDQQLVSDIKIDAVTNKYEHIKAANLALQVRMYRYRKTNESFNDMHS